MSGSRARVVVTGLGAVTPFGRGMDALWNGLCSAEHAFAEVELFDVRGHRTRIAGQVPEGTGIPRAHVAGRGSRSDSFAEFAALDAWLDAGLGGEAGRGRVGVFLGSSTGGMLEGEDWFARASQPRTSGAPVGRPRVSRMASQPCSSPAEAVARVLAVTGPVESVASACSAATMAIESALDALRRGEVDIAVAGGADALCQLTFGGFNSLRAVDEGPARPFRRDRSGLTLGEGAGVLVLETEEHARGRAARALSSARFVELAGAASSCDAFHMTAPDPDARGAIQALRAALADAHLSPEAVDFVDAHGTGTPHNDESEWRALTEVFGERACRLPVTANKGAVGHLLGACGGLEAAVTARALLEAVVPPTPGEGTLDPAGIDLVWGKPRPLTGPSAAVSLNLAFGGANAALVFRAHPGRPADAIPG
jgi:3-oxoacyl-[acyl-carrier-protein] synthase II